MEANRQKRITPTAEKEASQAILGKVGLFAEQLTVWNKQIIEDCVDR
jgi:hypothetical protein